MYQVFLGKISTLSTDSWAEALAESVPQNVDRARWLAARGLLSRLLAPQPPPISSTANKASPRSHVSPPSGST